MGSALVRLEAQVKYGDRGRPGLQAFRGAE